MTSTGSNLLLVSKFQPIIITVRCASLTSGQTSISRTGWISQLLCRPDRRNQPLLPLRGASSVCRERPANVNRFLERSVFASFDKPFVAACIDKFAFSGFNCHLTACLSRAVNFRKPSLPRAGSRKQREGIFPTENLSVILCVYGQETT
jgi:hypothetical protein